MYILTILKLYNPLFPGWLEMHSNEINWWSCQCIHHWQLISMPGGRNYSPNGDLVRSPFAFFPFPLSTIKSSMSVVIQTVRWKRGNNSNLPTLVSLTVLGCERRKELLEIWPWKVTFVQREIIQTSWHYMKGSNIHCDKLLLNYRCTFVTKVKYEAKVLVFLVEKTLFITTYTTSV